MRERFLDVTAKFRYKLTACSGAQDAHGGRYQYVLNGQKLQRITVLRIQLVCAKKGQNVVKRDEDIAVFCDVAVLGDGTLTELILIKRPVDVDDTFGY